MPVIMLGHNDYEPSPSWLERLKQWHNIKFMKVSGERASADHDSAEEWISNVFPDLVDGYEEADIFNADETGLFYKAYSNGTLASGGDRPTGGKVLKDRLTV